MKRLVGLLMVGLMVGAVGCGEGKETQDSSDSGNQAKKPVQFPDNFCIGYEDSIFGDVGFQFQKSSRVWFIFYLNFKKKRIVPVGNFTVSYKRTEDQYSFTIERDDISMVSWDNASSNPHSDMWKLIDMNAPKMINISGDGNIGASGSSEYEDWKQIECPTGFSRPL